MQDADDEQDAADPRRRERQLLGGDEPGDVVVPVALRREVDSEEDVRREDQVVHDVGEHDVALAGERVVVEDVGRVGPTEPLDERTQPHRHGDEHEGHGDFEDPPGHGEGSVRTRGQEEDGGRHGGDEHGGGGGREDAVPPAALVGLDAVDDPVEQVG